MAILGFRSTIIRRNVTIRKFNVKRDGTFKRRGTANNLSLAAPDKSKSSFKHAFVA